MQHETFQCRGWVKKLWSLYLTACNFRILKLIGIKFGVNQCYFILNITSQNATKAASHWKLHCVSKSIEMYNFECSDTH